MCVLCALSPRLPDVWVNETERSQLKTKVVHLSQLPPDTAMLLDPNIYRCVSVCTCVHAHKIVPGVFLCTCTTVTLTHTHAHIHTSRSSCRPDLFWPETLQLMSEPVRSHCGTLDLGVLLI